MRRGRASSTLRARHPPPPRGGPPGPATHRWEAIIASRDDTLAYIEHYVTEDDALVSTREYGKRVGAEPVSVASGAALRFLAAAIGARAVVEVGTGVGCSGVWILRGMRPDGILTSVDAAAEHQEFARETYRRAGFAGARTRLIHGPAMEVLPRLTDGAYDMVFVDAYRPEYPDYLRESLRLLRSGGIVVFNDALVANPLHDGPLSAPDPDTAAVREVGRLIRDDERLIPLLLPVGEGLLAAIRER